MSSGETLMLKWGVGSVITKKNFCLIMLKENQVENPEKCHSYRSCEIRFSKHNENQIQFPSNEMV